MEWILVSLLIAAGVLAVSLIIVLRRWKKGGKKQETDYQAMFNMGIAFAPVGIVLAITTGNPGMIGLSVMGIIYIVLGLQNKDKWKKK